MTSDQDDGFVRLRTENKVLKARPAPDGHIRSAGLSAEEVVS